MTGRTLQGCSRVPSGPGWSGAYGSDRGLAGELRVSGKPTGKPGAALLRRSRKDMAVWSAKVHRGTMLASLEFAGPALAGLYSNPQGTWTACGQGQTRQEAKRCNAGARTTQTSRRRFSPSIKQFWLRAFCGSHCLTSIENTITLCDRVSFVFVKNS